jgi:RNA polymerase sigma-70 factor (ECF subfamily)
VHGEQAATRPDLLNLAIAGEDRRERPLEEFIVGLYAELRPGLLGYLRQIVGSTGEAEDIVQVAFLRLFDQLQKGCAVEDQRSWMYKVCRNLAIDYLRRHDRRQAVATEWMAERERNQEEATVEERMNRREQVEIMLGKLNERERHCLLMRADGLSYKEIAGALEISAKSVSVYLVRGLKKFRREDGQSGFRAQNGSQNV